MDKCTGLMAVITRETGERAVRRGRESYTQRKMGRGRVDFPIMKWLRSIYLFTRNCREFGLPQQGNRTKDEAKYV